MSVDEAEARSRITLRKNAERRVSESAQTRKPIPRDNILELDSQVGQRAVSRARDPKDSRAPRKLTN